MVDVPAVRALAERLRKTAAGVGDAATADMALHDEAAAALIALCDAVELAVKAAQAARSGDIDGDFRVQEIEVTPEMVEAGVAELREKCFGENLEEIVTDVFYAMTIAHDGALPPAPLSGE